MEHSRGFALIELAAIIVVLAIVVSILFVMGDGARRNARLGEDLSNLRKLGTVTQSYAADFEDLFWSFSWRAGESHSQFPDLNNASSDGTAQANQAVDIVRRRSARVDHPQQPYWFPHVSFGPIVLADYLDELLPMRWVVSAADRNRLLMQQQVSMNRLPYQSSYQRAPVVFSSPASGSSALWQSSYGWLVPGGMMLGGIKMVDVAYPSQKMFHHETHQRHFGDRMAFFAYPEAQVPLLMMDGSAGVRRTADANEGWQPWQPQSPEPTTFEYTPVSGWDPPVPPGESPIVRGHYRWTRGGLQGRDFGGPEVWP